MALSLITYQKPSLVPADAVISETAPAFHTFESAADPTQLEAPAPTLDEASSTLPWILGGAVVAAAALAAGARRFERVQQARTRIFALANDPLAVQRQALEKALSKPLRAEEDYGTDGFAAYRFLQRGVDWNFLYTELRYAQALKPAPQTSSLVADAFSRSENSALEPIMECDWELTQVMNYNRRRDKEDFSRVFHTSGNARRWKAWLTHNPVVINTQRVCEALKSVDGRGVDAALAFLGAGAETSPSFLFIPESSLIYSNPTWPKLWEALKPLCEHPEEWLLGRGSRLTDLLSILRIAPAEVRDEAYALLLQKSGVKGITFPVLHALCDSSLDFGRQTSEAVIQALTVLQGPAEALYFLSRLTDTLSTSEAKPYNRERAVRIVLRKRIQAEFPNQVTDDTKALWNKTERVTYFSLLRKIDAGTAAYELRQCLAQRGVFNADPQGDFLADTVTLGQWSSNVLTSEEEKIRFLHDILFDSPERVTTPKWKQAAIAMLASARESTEAAHLLVEFLEHSFSPVVSAPEELQFAAARALRTFLDEFKPRPYAAFRALIASRLEHIRERIEHVLHKARGSFKDDDVSDLRQLVHILGDAQVHWENPPEVKVQNVRTD